MATGRRPAEDLIVHCPRGGTAPGWDGKNDTIRIGEVRCVSGSRCPSSAALEHSEHWDMAESYTGLKPVQQPRLPVYLGGYTPAAMHRVARRAEGWLPVVEVPGRFPPDLIRQALAGIRAEAERLGRDPGQIDAILRINGAPSATPAQLADAVVAASEQAGIDHSFVDLMYMTEDTGQALDFAAQVISQVRQVAGSA